MGNGKRWDRYKEDKVGSTLELKTYLKDFNYG